MTYPRPDRDRSTDADHVADLVALTAVADELWQTTTDAVTVTVVGTGGNVGAVEVITDRDVMVPATYYAPDGRTGNGWACWRETVDGSFRPDDDLVGYGPTPRDARSDLKDRAVRRLTIGERGTDLAAPPTTDELNAWDYTTADYLNGNIPTKVVAEILAARPVPTEATR